MFKQPLDLVGGLEPWIFMTFHSMEHTVDGRNPAPVDRRFIPLFIGV